MATRTRLAGSTSVQYEDFVPKYEWKEEQGANVLHVHLSDFQKEQMKITYVHSSRTIRVLGERQVSSNKWKRFNKVFTVPQNCEVSKIQGRFQDGVLFITMPKTIVTQAVPREEEAKASKEASTPSRTAALSPKTADPKPSSSSEAKAGKVLDETAGFAGQKQKDGKKVEESLGSKESLFKESKSEKGAGDSTEKVSAVSGDRVVDQTEQRNQREKQLLEQEDISKKRKESLITESKDEGIKKRKELEELERKTDVKTSDKEKGVKFGVGEDKPKKDAIFEKVKGVKDVAAASAKKTVKGFMELSEERKSMVNMGVAALVIVALGAYIAYSFRSSGNNTENQ